MSEPAAERSERPSALTDSAAGRLLGVLVAPAKTFESIARRPTWALALALHVVLGVAVAFVAIQHTDLGAAVRERLEKSGTTLSPEQMEQQVAVTEKFSKVLVPVSALIIVPVVSLLIALVFWLLLKAVGGELRYPVSLSVTLHGMMPQVIAALLALPLMAMHGLYSQDELKRGVVASSPAFLAPEGASPALVALLTSLDLFSLWSLALLVIGYRRTARTSTAATAGVAIGAWLLYVLGKIGIAAAFGR
jgi:hypothetical protein